MLLVVGLGNPGAKYANNRHNIGFMAVDEIVRRHSFSSSRAKFQSEIAEGNIAGEKILAMKPRTYMNESGLSVQAVMVFYKLTPEDVIVIHDEIDLAGGKVRVKRGGGHAGHNGLRSIHARIGANYARVRLGVGHPGDKANVAGHVLKDFAKSERDWVERMVCGVGEYFPLLVGDDDSTFMSKMASVVNPPCPKPPGSKASKHDAQKREKKED